MSILGRPCAVEIVEGGRFSCWRFVSGTCSQKQKIFPTWILLRVIGFVWTRKLVGKLLWHRSLNQRSQLSFDGCELAGRNSAPGLRDGRCHTSLGHAGTPVLPRRLEVSHNASPARLHVRVGFRYHPRWRRLPADGFVKELFEQGDRERTLRLA